LSRKKTFSITETFNDIRADFRAGQDSRFVSRLTGVASMGSGADYHYRVEQQWLHMLERARFYQRNDQVVGQGIRRVVANIVQDGFRLDPQTGDDALDSDIKARWLAWSTDPDQCHNEGEFSFSEMEILALSSVITDGDTFCLPLKSGQLQFVEAHRCRRPSNTVKNVVHGVLMDDNAKRLEYWFTKENLNPWQPLSKVADIKPYPVRDPKTGERQVFHLYMPYRFSQRRGITFIAPCSDTVGMHDDVQFATLVKSQMAALVAILHERDTGWEPASDQQKGDRYTDAVGANGFTRQIEGVAAGLEVFGDPGEKLRLEAPNIPSASFFPHTMLLLTFIAINLDIPVHVLLLDPSNTNFSGWRGAIDQARLRFKQIQNWMQQKFHAPVYRWWLRQQAANDSAIAAALMRQGPDFFLHRWNPPQFPYIEPFTDAQADDLQINRCLNSRRRIQAARGRDQEEIAAELVADNADMIRRAVKEAGAINTEFPDAEVNWREILSLPLPDVATTNLMLSGSEPPAAKTKQQPGNDE
jgi:lambda family phage portal protein